MRAANGLLLIILAKLNEELMFSFSEKYMEAAKGSAHVEAIRLR